MASRPAFLRDAGFPPARRQSGTDVAGVRQTLRLAVGAHTCGPGTRWLDRGPGLQAPSVTRGARRGRRLLEFSSACFFQHRSQRAQPFKTSWLHRGEEGRSLSFLPGPRSPEAATASRSPVAAIMSRGVSPPDCVWPGEGLVTSSLGGEDVDAPPPAPPAHRASRR